MEQYMGTDLGGYISLRICEFKQQVCHFYSRYLPRLLFSYDSIYSLVRDGFRD